MPTNRSGMHDLPGKSHRDENQEQDLQGLTHDGDLDHDTDEDLQLL